MSFHKELQQLQQQQRRELATLHLTYLSTRRAVKRKISPDRFIRKHLAASLGAAAVAGLLLAPRPGPHHRMSSQSKSDDRASPSTISRLIRGLLSQFERLVSPPSRRNDLAAEDGSPSHASRTGGLLQSLLATLISRIDFSRLLMELYRRFQGPASAEDLHHGNGRSTPASTPTTAAEAQSDDPAGCPDTD